MMRTLWLLCVALTCVHCADPYVNVPFKPDPALWALTCSDFAVDWQDATCHDAAWQLPACGAPVLVDAPDQGSGIVPLPTPLTYTEAPPLSGLHRPDWARWGEYAYLPPQRWLYNLELGGIAVLYNPCVPASFVEDLRQFLRNQPDDDGGQLRWVLTPDPNVKLAFTIVARRHSFSAACLDTTAASAFVQAHYRQALQDNAAAGWYSWAWLGRMTGLYSAPNAPAPACDDAGSTGGG